MPCGGGGTVSTRGLDKGKSKISPGQGGRLQAGPKEWPPGHAEAGVGALRPRFPLSLSACSLEMGRSPGINEATLHPGIWEHKRGLGRAGAGLRQCGERQLLIRAGEGADRKPVLPGVYVCVLLPSAPGVCQAQGLLPPWKTAYKWALPPPGPFPLPLPLPSKMENLENQTGAVRKKCLPSFLPGGERRGPIPPSAASEPPRPSPSCSGHCLLSCWSVSGPARGSGVT